MATRVCFVGNAKFPEAHGRLGHFGRVIDHLVATLNPIICLSIQKVDLAGKQLKARAFQTQKAPGHTLTFRQRNRQNSLNADHIPVEGFAFGGTTG